MSIIKTHWVVEYGPVNKGDILRRIVKEEFVVQDEKDLDFVTVEQLRQMGFRIYRKTKKPRK